jgi:hypothetical protein
MRKHNPMATLTLAFVVSLACSGASAQAVLDEGYLIGNWSLEGADQCNVGGSEHIEFRADRTLTLGRGGEADAAGFFEVSGNRIDLHLVASPHRITGALHHMEGRYGYGDLAVFAFDPQQDSFEAIVPFRNDVNRRTVHRCQ